MHEVIRTNVGHLKQCRLRLESESLLLEQWTVLDKVEQYYPLDDAEGAVYDRYLQYGELAL